MDLWFSRSWLGTIDDDGLNDVGSVRMWCAGGGWVMHHVWYHTKWGLYIMPEDDVFYQYIQSDSNDSTLSISDDV